MAAPKPRSGEVGAAALARGLHDALTAAQGARVVVVSSSAQSPVVFDDIHFTSRPYDAYYCAYAQSKAATILFTVAIANRWAVDAITANALNPAPSSPTSSATSPSNPALHRGARRAQPPAGGSPGLGKPTAGRGHLGAARRIPARRGGDWSLLRGLQRSRRPHRDLGDGTRGVAPHALDQNDADRLWDETTRLLHH